MGKNLPYCDSSSTLYAYGCRVACDRVLDQDVFHPTSTLHGLKLLSAPTAVTRKNFSVQVPFRTGHGRELVVHTDKPFGITSPGQSWCFEVVGVNRFFWTSREKTIYYNIEKAGNNELLGFWFLHIFLPLFFTLEGYYKFLHAGAVEVDGKVVLFIAPSMGGKSTLTDYFINQGHILVSDDKVATYLKGNHYFAVPSHPHHRPYRAHEDLGYWVTNFSHKSKPIHAIYVLEATQPESDIDISEERGTTKFETLMPAWLYNFSFLQPLQLEYIAGVLNKVPLYRVQLPWSLERLGEIHDSICLHSKNIN